MNSYLTDKRHTDQVLSVETHGARAATIATSWRRCLESYRLDPQHNKDIQILTSGELRAAQSPLDHLISIADNALADLCTQVTGANYIVMLTDAKGITVSTKALGDAGAFGKWGLLTGAVWSEEIEGTNGVGVCLKEGHPITVHRDEHFKSRYIGLTCTVAPIFDPVGNLVGGLDISSSNQKIDECLIAFAQFATNFAAARIEKQCFRYAYRDCWIVSLDEKLEGCALIAFNNDRQLIGANRSARLTLGINDESIRKGIEVIQRDLTSFPFVRQPTLVRDGLSAFLNLGLSPKIEFSPERGSTFSRARMANCLDPRYFVQGSEQAEAAKRRIEASARSGIPIILFGEPGTGKALFARAVHDTVASVREPFIWVDGTLPEVELERELFGVAGDPSNEGKILPSEGTLFLDNIEALPPTIQARLLRILNHQDASFPTGLPFRRIFSSAPEGFEVAESAGGFRADLYYFLRGTTYLLPPLRYREDKASLISHLLSSIDPRITLSPEAYRALNTYSWPGNIQELIQTLRVASTTCVDRRISLQDLDLPFESLDARIQTTEAPEAELSLDWAQRSVITKQLMKNNFDVAKTAAVLQMSRATLYRRMKRLKL